MDIKNVADGPVPVYILSVDSRSQRAQQTRHLFNDSMFRTNIVTVDTPKDLSMEGLAPDDAEEIYRFQKILTHSWDNHDGDIIVVKDTSRARFSAIDITETIRSIKTEPEQADITYLSAWQDDNKIPNKRKLLGGTTVSRSSEPNAFQAILISPHGRDVLLGKAELTDGQLFAMANQTLTDGLNTIIEQGGISADVLSPTMFDARKVYKRSYPTPKQAIENGIIPLPDSELGTQVESQMSTSVAPVAIIFIIIVIMLVLWAIYYYSSNQKR